ncbi:MAG: hypothetical protein H6558_21915 [Lewinellaceae bacterium]|nr:hypothetical protein [Lewinellaceae bacterium]MCB9287443.1 hypothetical protein [Lewinellaceae bacterium]
MRASTLICFLPLAVLAAVYPAGSAGQPAVAGLAPGAKESTLRLEGTHQAVSCLKQQEITPPVVYASDNANTSLAHKDQYFKLGCAVSGFTEYFAPSRWAAAKIIGDGGVDVTGAPNSILVEGANRASVIATPGSAASYRIAIPADGYISFDWVYIGGSNFLNQKFWIEVNGEHIESMAPGHTSGSFFSSLLHPGDELSFNIDSDGKGFSIQLSGFEFLSNAIGVIERHWQAHSENGARSSFTQLISIKKPDFNQVIFPGNCDGIINPRVESGASAEPQWTGFPVIDEDGSLATTDDQYPLSDDGCSFSVKWEDEALYDNGECIIFRHWTVSDYCGGNVQTQTQVIKVEGGCPEGATPLPYGQFAPGGEENRQSPALPQNYSMPNMVLEASLSDNPLSVPEGRPVAAPAD